MADLYNLVVTGMEVRFVTPGRIVQAVAGVDISLKTGEMLGIVGESGCGKTALALSIMGLLPHPPAQITYQSAFFDSAPLPLDDEEKMRSLRGKRIAMIFQEPMSSLNPVIAVGEQIAEVIRLHLHLDKKEAATRAVELLDEVGIPRPQEATRSYPHQLSGGMRQRVMIAIAFSCRPDIIIADEPTTALDVTVQAQILHLLRHLREKNGAAFLFISHDIALVAQEANRIAVMYAGKIVESGGGDDIFRHPRHPYTKGLRASLPDFANHTAARKRLPTIPGLVPELDGGTHGCAFAKRCSLAKGICRESAPPLKDYGTYMVACWQHGK